MSADGREAGAGKLPEKLWDCIRAEIESSGERVLWESREPGRSSESILPKDYHGYARWQGTHVSGIALLLFMVCLLMLLDVGFFGAWVILMFAGALVASVLGRRARSRAISDVGARRYLLTDERLLMVGDDSFVELSLSDVQWVLKHEHRGGTGTVVCIYDGGPPGGKIAVENIEDYDELYGLIREHAPSLLRNQWQTVLPNGYARKLRQR